MLRTNDIHVNNLGFIDFWSGDECISPENSVYILYFKDHSRLDPACKHLNTSSEITNFSVNKKSTIRYTKEIENISLCVTLDVGDDWLHWKFSITNEYFTGHRFGIVYPTAKGSHVYLDQKLIQEPIVNYFNAFPNSFRDQAISSVPLFTVYGNYCTSFCGPLDMDMQLFYNEQNNNARMTVSTTDSDCFDLWVYRTDQLGSEKKFFINLYPESNELINKWVELLQNLEQQYKLHIFYNTSGSLEFYEKTYKYERPQEKELDHFVSMFVYEISKYYPSSFRDLEIDVVLVKSMTMLYRGIVYKVHGALFPSNINTRTQLFLDAEHLDAWIIHHEIFHAIDHEIDFQKWPQGNYDLFENNFGMKDNRWQHSNADEEFRADLFSRLMINQEEINQLATTNNLLKEQITILKDEAQRFVSFSKPQDRDSRVVYLVDDNRVKKIPFGKLVDGKHFVSQV